MRIFSPQPPTAVPIKLLFGLLPKRFGDVHKVLAHEFVNLLTLDFSAGVVYYALVVFPADSYCPHWWIMSVVIAVMIIP